jgi:hypothetical protein
MLPDLIRQLSRANPISANVRYRARLPVPYSGLNSGVIVIGSNLGEIAMRHPRVPSIVLVAAVTAALAPTTVMAQTSAEILAQAQPPASSPDKQPPALPPAPAPGPYKPVAITLPAPLNDPSFDAFRKQLAALAQKKDRAALAPLVAASFFWVPEDADLADKKKSGIDNLAKALSLDGADAIGWDAVTAYAAETTIMADPQRTGVFCAPAEPAYDDKAADELANATQTDASDWGFPIRDGIEVRSAAKQDAPVVDKLGLYLVRILADDSPANAVLATFLKVMSSSGKAGYVPIDSVLPIGGEQLCYIKEASGWKIAGFLGGEPNQ